MTSVSVVIPVYNSEQSIAQVVADLHTIMPQVCDVYEIILVEDGGTDNSWLVIESLSDEHSNVRGIQLMRNYGQHSALLCGIRDANHEIIVTMDDDLQHPSNQLPKLLHYLQDGYDVVYGSPEREQHSLFRNLASQVTKIVLQGAMGADTARNISAFRVFRTNLRNGFVDYQGPFPNLDVLLTWSTKRFVAVKVPHQPRKFGQSNYTFWKLVVHTLNMLTGFSTIPLQLASLSGFLLTLLGVILLFYVIVIRVFILGYEVPGFTFTASIIVIFSGAQLFTLGIFGEYLARMHFRIMDRPTYVVRETTDDANVSPKQSISTALPIIESE